MGLCRNILYLRVNLFVNKINSILVLVQLDSGTVPWAEMPLGVIKRDVCSESQDPNYNKRAPMSTERMRTKRAQLCRKLARNITNAIMGRWWFYKPRNGGESSADNVMIKMEYWKQANLQHNDNWVKTMETGWVEFRALVK